MEASSLTFGDSETSLAPAVPKPSSKPCHVPLKKAAVADAHAPSVRIPLSFILTGILALLAGAGLLVLRPDVLATYHYNQYVIAISHLFILGWICSVIMGAMYQLVPVALETRLHSEKLARWHYGLHVAGFTGMVAMFWIWDMKQVGHFGSALAIGVGLFVYNLVRTLRRVPRWNIVATGISAALGWLSFTILAGLYLSAAKCWDFSPFAPLSQMHAHAHLGVIGFFVMMMVGVSYKLVPMFTLSELQSVRRATWSIGLLNVGLLGVFVAVLFDHASKFGFALIVISGLAVYAVELRAILCARKRRALDWGLKSFLTGIALLLPVSALGAVLAWPRLPATAFTTQLENVYGFLALLGVVTLALLGMLYKIIPFLVWYTSYSKAIGRYKVPSLAGLYSARLQALGYWLFLASLPAVITGTLLGSELVVRWSCLAFALSLAPFALNIVFMLRHFIRPQLEPLATVQTQSRTA